MFSIELYNNTAESNRLDKTDYLEDVVVLNGTLRDGCSVIDPIVIIESGVNIVINRNYAHISSFNRYYFIRNYTFLTTNLIQLELHVDVLMSFKTDIEKLNGILERTSKTEYQNNFILDYNVPLTKQISINKYPLEPIEGFDYLIGYFSSSGDTLLATPTIVFETISNGVKVSLAETLNYLKKYAGVINANGSAVYVNNTMNDGVFAIVRDGTVPHNVQNEVREIIYKIASDESIASFFLSCRTYPFDVAKVLPDIKNYAIKNNEEKFCIPYNNTNLELTINNIGSYYFASILQTKPTFIFSMKYTPLFNDFRAYEPYTEIELMIPFDKNILIDARILKKFPYINVIYIVNFKTGTSDIYVNLTNYEVTSAGMDLNEDIEDANVYRYYHTSVSISFEIPINKTNNEGIKREKTSAMLKYIGNTLGILLTGGHATSGFTQGGPMGALAGGAKNMQQHITDGFNLWSELVTLVPSGYESSTESELGNVCNFLRQPFLIVKSNISTLDPRIPLYNNIYGRPSGVALNKLSFIKAGGYHRFKQIHVENTPATSDEKDEIEKILTSGFLY